MPRGDKAHWGAGVTPVGSGKAGPLQGVGEERAFLGGWGCCPSELSQPPTPIPNRRATKLEAGPQIRRRICQQAEEDKSNPA